VHRPLDTLPTHPAHADLILQRARQHPPSARPSAEPQRRSGAAVATYCRVLQPRNILPRVATSQHIAARCNLATYCCALQPRARAAHEGAPIGRHGQD
jgi:hypothetical protein